MHIAINTSSLADNTPEALERAADLGFSRVEIDLLSNEFNYGYRRKPDVKFYRQLSEQLQRMKLSAWSVTAPPLSQEEMFSKRARREILKGGAGAAGLLGAKVFVVRPADIFLDQLSYDQYIQDHSAPPVVEGFDEAWVQVVNRQMTMALLNRDYWIGSVLTNHPERLTAITSDLAIGCAFDIRRAVYRDELPEWLGQLGDRLAVAYAYDLDEDGSVSTPSDVSWQGWLRALMPTRLKCLVLIAGRDQQDDEITSSRMALESWMG